MTATTWRKCSWISPATAARRCPHEPARITPPDLGIDVSPPRALSPVLAEAAGARLLAGTGHVHLGLHRDVPRRTAGCGSRRRGLRPAWRHVVVGGLPAQPDGHG